MWFWFSSLLLFLYFNNGQDVGQPPNFDILLFLFSFNIIFCIKKLDIDTSKALFWVLVSFSLYHLVPLFFYNIIDFVKYLDFDKSGIMYNSLKSNILFKSFLVSIIGFQSTIISYIFMKNRFRIDNRRFEYNILIVYLSIIFLIVAILSRQFISLTFLTSIEPVVFLIFSIFIFSKRNIIVKRKKLLVIAAFIFLLILFALNTTGRRDLIKMIVLFSVLWSLYIKPFKLRYILAGGIFCIFIMLGLVLYRTTFSIQDVWTRINLIFNNSDYLFLMVSSTLDFMPGHNNYEFIVENVPTESPYLYGASLSKILFLVIPRQLWPNKPSGVQELIVQQHDNIFVGGSSQTTTMIGEFYWNFGIIGVVIGMGVLGYICKKIDCNNLINNGTFQFMLRVIIVSWLIELFRGGLSTIIIINTLQIIIPLIIIIVIYTLINRPKLIS